MPVLGQRREDIGEIACILGITERTVNYHLNQVTRKTGSMNRYQAIAKGVSSGILLPNLEQVVVTNFPLPAAVNTGPAAPARRLASPLSPSPLSCAVPSCRRFSGRGCDPQLSDPAIDNLLCVVSARFSSVL